jgi:protein arginine kinase
VERCRVWDDPEFTYPPPAFAARSMSVSVQPAWIDADGPDSAVVVSTRARLARNLAALPFPWKASPVQLRRVSDLVVSAARRLQGLGYGLDVVRIDDLSESDKMNLVDAHVVSPEHLSGGPERVVILVPGGKVAIMVNEEDHLRIQSVMPGLMPEDAWAAVDDIDEELAGALEFAYSGRYGYLTASVTNVGTGLRVSALMHLGGLAMLGKVRTTLRAAYDLGVSVRGLFGEGSSGLGDLFQVSNEVTLGLEEREIVARVRGVAEYLLRQESLARSEFGEEQRPRLLAQVKDALTAAQRARSVSAAEMLRLLSPIRIACSVGVAEGLEPRIMKQVLGSLRVRHGTDRYTSRFDMAREDVDRANLLRDKLRDVSIDAPHAPRIH